MTLAPSILIVEDDPKTAELIDRFLTKEGFRTARAADGHAAIDAFAAVGPDLVILDVMLPKVDGFEVCAVIRRTSKVPILFLTARTEEADLVLGLGLGADDYVAKPFSPRELVARAKALLRRAGLASGGDTESAKAISGLTFDRAKRRFSLHGRPLELTAIEFTLLQSLFSSPGKVFLRSELLDQLYPRGDPVIDRVVDVHIGKLRQKLGDDPVQPVFSGCRKSPILEQQLIHQI
jgi:DNA-binding response OmpR family regulator